MPPDRPDRGPAAPPAAEADAFDLWLRRGLQARYATIVAEPLPPALLSLAQEAAETLRQVPTGPATAAERFDQRVRERAYFLWLEEGRPEGRAMEHWMAAFVGQIAQESADRTDAAAFDPRHPSAGATPRPGRRPGPR